MTSATLHQGWPGDSACNLLVLSTDEGEAKFFWADAYYNKVKDQWSIRAGRDMGGSVRMETTVVGSDVFLQYVPIDQEFVPVSHFSVSSKTDSAWLVCT